MQPVLKPERSGKQQLAQVVGKDPDRLVIGFLAGLRHGFVLHRRGDQAFAGIRRGGLHIGPGGRIAPDDHRTKTFEQSSRIGRSDRKPEKTLALAAGHSQKTVGGNPSQRFPHIEIVGILHALVLASFHGTGSDDTLPFVNPPDRPAYPFVLGDPFGHDVAGSGERLMLVLRTARRETPDQRRDGHGILPHEQRGQRLQSLLPGHRGPGFPFGLVRQINILQTGAVVALFDPPAQFVGQSALLLDRGKDRPLAFSELVQAFQPFAYRTDLHFVQSPGGLLAVPAQERDGSTLPQQTHGVAHTCERQSAQSGHLPHDIVVRFGRRHFLRFSDKNRETVPIEAKKT